MAVQSNGIYLCYHNISYNSDSNSNMVAKERYVLSELKNIQKIGNKEIEIIMIAISNHTIFRISFFAFFLSLFNTKVFM